VLRLDLFQVPFGHWFLKVQWTKTLTYLHLPLAAPTPVQLKHQIDTIWANNQETVGHTKRIRAIKFYTVSLQRTTYYPCITKSLYQTRKVNQIRIRSKEWSRFMIHNMEISETHTWEKWNQEFTRIRYDYARKKRKEYWPVRIGFLLGWNGRAWRLLWAAATAKTNVSYSSAKADWSAV